MSGRYTVSLSPAAVRALSHSLPEGVAAAVWEFIDGPLRDNPQRVGKRMHEPQADVFSARRGTYRVLYSIDDDSASVVVLHVSHRRDAYRSRD